MALIHQGASKKESTGLKCDNYKGPEEKVKRSREVVIVGSRHQRVVIVKKKTQVLHLSEAQLLLRYQVWRESPECHMSTFSLNH